MAVLSWGKPYLEFGVSVGGAQAASFTAMPTPKEQSTQLTTTKGDKVEAKEEGGAVVDSKTKAGTSSLVFDLFVKKGFVKPIQDIDGVVAGDYSIRLTPEDPETEGFVMDNCSVSVEDLWSAEDGGTVRYTFDGKKPASGAIRKPYIAGPLVVTPTSLSFTSAADATGKTITATATGTVTATSDSGWATVTVVGAVATVKVTENTGASRTANITINADGKTKIVACTQAAA
jgi:hypothetical protein